MEAIAYSFGGDVVIRAGEAALCGVTGAVLREKAERCDVLEFLTDKPVARLKSREFQLEMKLRVPRGGDPEELLGSNTFTLTEGESSVTLEGCRLISLDCRLDPESCTEYTALIAADDRRVSHE